MCIRFVSRTADIMTLTPSTADESGLSRSGLYRATKSGTYQRIARGLYLPATATPADWDLLEAAARHAQATICLTSALAYHDLTDDIPRTLEVAIPRGSRPPTSRSSISWHLFHSAQLSDRQAAGTQPAG